MASEKIDPVQHFDTTFEGEKGLAQDHVNLNSNISAKLVLP